MLKKLLCILLILAMIVGLNPAWASSNGKDQIPWGQFKDLNQNYWAFPAIQDMIERGILKGFEDNTFRPNSLVTRAEFAKIMVIALDLDVPSIKASGFVDVPDKHWALPYIEAARDYLTGYQSASGIKFKPNEAAVREDMAVALVRALKLPMSSLDILNAYVDTDQISAELKPFVATAIANNIIKGSEVQGKKYFNPLGELTRAEAAQLIANVLKENEKKVVLPKDDKIVLPVKPVQPKPVMPAVTLKAKTTGGSIDLYWYGDVPEKKFSYYKVVASLSNPKPQYPEDGYVRAIDDYDAENFRIKIGTSNNNGDFYKFEAGKTYNIAITTVYSDGTKATSNVVQVTMSNAEIKPVEIRKPVVLSGVYLNGKLYLSWQGNVTQQELEYYKVVASISKSNPKYPDDGYAAYFTDVKSTGMTIQPGMSYNGGDFKKFENGKTYNFTVTTVYKDGTKLTSNVLNATLP